MSEFKEKTRRRVTEYQLAGEYLKTRVNDEIILIPLSGNQNGLNGTITLDEVGYRMFSYIRDYQKKEIILEHLYSDYPEYTKKEVEDGLEDFVIKLKSEKILL